MSETYVPRTGDRVRFYSWAAQLDLTGEVLSVAPQARMATVREDNEEGSTCIKSWDVLRLVEESSGLVQRLRDERDEAQAQVAEMAEIQAETVKRAEKAETDLAQCRKALHDAIAEAAEVEKDRDGWVQEAKDNEYISRIGYDERDKARARVKELEAQLAKLQAQIDAAPYATGYPVGDRVAARLAEYRERAHAAEDELAELKSALKTLSN